MTKTVITYGSFDMFHVGHLRLLERCRALGGRVIVGCSTDEFNEVKGKKSIINFEHRAEILRGCRYVDLVIPETAWDQKRADISRFNVDIFAMGDDWAGKFNDLSDVCTVSYLPRTLDISTTELKSHLAGLASDKKRGIEQTLERLCMQISQLG